MGSIKNDSIRCLTGSTSFTLIAYFEDGTSTRFQTDPIDINPTNEVYTNEELSTLADTPENQTRRTVENEILKRLRSPVRPHEGRNWTTALGSSHHNGIDAHALDLNWGSEIADEGLPVFSSFSGVVSSVPNPNNYGIVEIKHVINLQIGNDWKDIEFTSRYLHMKNIHLKANDVIQDFENTQIGDVSDVGDIFIEGDMQPHLHFAVYYKLRDQYGNIIVYTLDLENWLLYHAISLQ